MKITPLTPDDAILKELGTRLASTRKQQGMAQTDLAKEAGIGVATLRRIEGGQDSQLLSWLKLLKALGMSSTIDSLLANDIASPMEQVRGTSRKRSKPRSSAAIVWGDEKE